MEAITNGAIVKEEETVKSEAKESKVIRKTITLQKLKAGEQPFAAWGYSVLKVVRDRLLDENDPDSEIIREENLLRVPIKSIGLNEVMERVSRKTPTAPITRTMIRQDSEEGRALGLKANRITEVENFADLDYKELLRKYHSDSSYKLILGGLAIDIVEMDAAGNEVKVVQANDNNTATKIIDEEKAILILKGQGISDEHANQMYDDIKNLTKREEERVDRD